MIELSQKESPLKIIIPLSGIRELQDYKNGILGVLKHITINDSSQGLIDNLKLVYKLLGHLSLDDGDLSKTAINT